MSSGRLRIILIALLGMSVAGFVALGFLGLSFLSGKSKHMVDLKIQSKTADSQLSSLEQSKKLVSKYSYFKDVASTVIPNDKDQAETVLEIFNMAAQSGIAIQSITFPTSNLGTTAPTTAGSTQDATSSAASSSIISQAKPVPGIPGLYSIQLTITPQTTQAPLDQQATYPKLLDFLSRIENNRHTAQITQVSIQPQQGNQYINFNLTINIFIKPSK